MPINTAIEMGNKDLCEYWRSLDLWTLREFQFLLAGSWPDELEPPTKPAATLIDLDPILHADERLDKGVREDEPGYVVDPMPFSSHTTLAMIEDAVASGRLTPIKPTVLRAERPLNQRDLEPRFRVEEAVNWAASKSCFPDFPWNCSAATNSMGIKGQTEGVDVSTPGVVPKSLPIRAQQEEAIIGTLRSLGYDPLNLPARVPGRSWVKEEVRSNLEKRGGVFVPKSTTFNKAWERLRAAGRILDAR